jgi:two-component system, OmpR family, sensor histidine kinase MtrB
MRRLGLRARVTVVMAGGALILTTAVATLSYEFTRGSLLGERERTATRTTYFDATAVRADLAGEGVDIVSVLRALNTGPLRRPVVVEDGTPFSTSAGFGSASQIPAGLQQMVEGGQAGAQRVRTPSGPALIIGIPLTPTTQFYEFHSMQELDQTLSVIGIILTLVAAGTTVAGAGLGWYTTRRALRPLASVAEAAKGIAAGDLTARLDDAVEPELERLTRSFNHMVDQLAQRIERDRRFAADVSHELRSPLQTLSAAATVLSNRRNSMDERTATAAQLISDEVLRFQQLVTDLLEIAKGHQPPDWSDVDVAAMARQLCKERELDPGIVCVEFGAAGKWRVDRRRLERIIGNLIDNAREHGGGAVAVRLGCHRHGHFIEVDDGGPGVVPEDRRVIFDPFVRGRAAQARGDSNGAGLGLAIVAQHAETHGGHAEVVDRPGGGARFRVTINGPAR